MKLQFKILFVLFLLLSTFKLSAQVDGVVRCATVEQDAIMRANNPKIGTIDDFEKFLAKEIKAKQLAAQSSFVIGDVYIIPVVVHVIHNNEAIGVGLNISYNRIQDQIATLNNDYRRKTGTSGFNAHPDGADTKIEFRLAKQMPNGTAFGGGEDGVNRILWSNIAGLTGPNGIVTADINSLIKPYTNGQGWDPTRYMNFWVCDMGGGLLGFAQFPSASIPGVGCTAPVMATDGVVMTTSSVGGSTFTSGPPPYNIGRTATHEIGHWLGLRHTWGDGNCSVDDFCTDTPNSGAPNYGCTANVSCGNNDMIENYMDYTDDACMNIFTNDQSIRMRTVLETSTVRSQLIQSTTWQAPAANSALVKQINSPFFEICNGTVTPNVLVSNVGTNVLNTITIEYTIDGGIPLTKSFTALGVAQGATTTLTLNPSVVALGDHNISIRVTSPVVQAIPETRNFTYTLGFGLPFSENFDTNISFPPPSWQLSSSNGCYNWGSSSAIGLVTGTTTQAAVVDNFNSSVTGNQAFLYTPILTMPCGATGVSLDFDIAYKGAASEVTEGLAVEVSTDCGVTWSASGYAEFGATLSNSTNEFFASPYSGYIPALPGEWRHKTVNLNAFVNVGADTQMLLRFVSTNEYGNNLYVDNVMVDATYNEVDVFLVGTEIFGDVPIDMGTTTVGVPIVKTYTVKNTGTATLTITTASASITGTEFSVTNFGSLVLTSGTSTTFDVSYNAITSGTFTETISFTTDDCNEATFTFNVTGNITPAACATPPAPLIATNIWIGCTDSGWNTASNWSTGLVPIASDVIYIPVGTPNELIITQAVICAKMIVQIGGRCSIDYNAGGKLLIKF